MSATPSAMAHDPKRPILLRQRNQLAVRPGARRPPGIGQQHQRQQARHLAVVRQQVVHRAGQPDRLVRQSLRCRSGPMLLV